MILFAAELIGSQGGLGTLISEGEDAARFDLMLAGIVMFAVLGFASDRILMAIRRRVLRAATTLGQLRLVVDTKQLHFFDSVSGRAIDDGRPGRLVTRAALTR